MLDLMAHMSGGTILDVRRADGAMNTWFIVMIVLLGVGALSLRRYDVQRVLISIAFGRFMLGARLLGYGGGHLRPRRQACSLHISAMQTMARRFDFGIAGAVTSCPPLSGCFGVFGDIEANNGARDMPKERHACCGRLAECNQRCKG
jgi:hypothetical protein